MSPHLAAWLERRRRAAAAEGERATAIARERMPEIVQCLVDEFGATRIVLFGSLLSGRLEQQSDVDLAVRGIAPARYFDALARVTEILGRDVDLVELDRASASLLRRIRETGEVLHAGDA